MKHTRWKALDTYVIVVAVEGEIEDWAAYIGSVEGHNHDVEWLEVRDNGSKLPENVAVALFPDFMYLRYRG